VSTPIPADPAVDAAPVPAPSITAPALGLIGAVAGLLAGGWLMYSPWALGYTPDGADWTDATLADFWTGFGLAVIALIAAGVLTAGLVAALRGNGVLAARKRPEAVAEAPAGPPAAAGGGDELTALLRPLVEALNKDAASTPNGATPTTRATDPAQH
jgi:hypothetical protein